MKYLILLLIIGLILAGCGGEEGGLVNLPVDDIEAERQIEGAKEQVRDARWSNRSVAESDTDESIDLETYVANLTDYEPEWTIEIDDGYWRELLAEWEAEFIYEVDIADLWRLDIDFDEWAQADWRQWGYTPVYLTLDQYLDYLEARTEEIGKKFDLLCDYLGLEAIFIEEQWEPEHWEVQSKSHIDWLKGFYE